MLGFIIQARMGSTRLQGKVLKPFYDNKCILEIIIDNLKLTFPKIPIIVATTNTNSDSAIVEAISHLGVKVYRGSEFDVLGRFVDAANTYGLNAIVRICSDNPFIDMQSLIELINTYEANDYLDYLSYMTKEGTPSIKTHYGFWAEIVTLDALKRVQMETSDATYCEHVTNYIYGNSDLFKIKFIELDEIFSSKSHLRMTIDTQDDFLLLQEIYAHMHKSKNGVLKLALQVSKNQNWLEIMKKNIEKNEK